MQDNRIWRTQLPAHEVTEMQEMKKEKSWRNKQYRERNRQWWYNFATIHGCQLCGKVQTAETMALVPWKWMIEGMPMAEAFKKVTGLVRGASLASLVGAVMENGATCEVCVESIIQSPEHLYRIDHLNRWMIREGYTVDEAYIKTIWENHHPTTVNQPLPSEVKMHVMSFIDYASMHGMFMGNLQECMLIAFREFCEEFESPDMVWVEDRK